MKNAIDTEHHLDFLAADYPGPFNDHSQKAYKIGTCNGLYKIDGKFMILIAINNDNPGNGHLNDVFQWFEWAAKEAGMPLMIVAFMNERFYNHCINKRGFLHWTWENEPAVIKFPQDIDFKTLWKCG